MFLFGFEVQFVVIVKSRIRHLGFRFRFHFRSGRRRRFGVFVHSEGKIFGSAVAKQMHASRLRDFAFDLLRYLRMRLKRFTLRLTWVLFGPPHHVTIAIRR